MHPETNVYIPTAMNQFVYQEVHINIHVQQTVVMSSVTLSCSGKLKKRPHISSHLAVNLMVNDSLTQ